VSLLKDIGLLIKHAWEDRGRHGAHEGVKGGYLETHRPAIFTKKLTNKYDHRKAESGANSLGDNLQMGPYKDSILRGRRFLDIRKPSSARARPARPSNPEEIIEGVTYSSIDEFKKQTEARKKGS